MPLNNKLGIANTAELARIEEKISKAKDHELFETKMIDTFPVGRFAGLQNIHDILFSEIYDFAEKVCNVNIAKGNYHFVPVMY